MTFHCYQLLILSLPNTKILQTSTCMFKQQPECPHGRHMYKQRATCCGNSNAVPMSSVFVNANLVYAPVRESLYMVDWIDQILSNIFTTNVNFSSSFSPLDSRLPYNRSHGWGQDYIIRNRRIIIAVSSHTAFWVLLIMVLLFNNSLSK